MSHIVGIDLGTTNSAVGIMRNGKPSVITTVEGKRIPSVVAFSKNGERLIGQAARQQAALNPENTVFSVKRFLGRRSEEEGMGAECSRVPYQIVNDGHGGVYINLPYAGRKCSPPEIAALILSKLKKEAEAYLGEPVEQAVLTVPAYFNDSQRQAVKEAGRIAGMEILRIINEPTAAALAYGQNRKEDEVILVCDLGGGTYDVSVLEVTDGLIAVRASSGDSYLGGEDWDTAISDWIIDQFLRTHGVDLAKNRRALQRVKEAAERAKIELSTSSETEIFLPFIIADGNGPKHLRMRLSREKLEALTAPLLQRLEEPLRRALLDARLTPAEIDAVVLVGGMSRNPAVQEKIRTLTGQEPTTKVDPDEVVVLGAALQAGLLSGQVQDMHLRDVTPLSLGLETMGGMMSILIPRNTTIPARRSEVFSTAEDGQTEVKIHVLQGERPVAADNNSLGIFRLEGIRPAPRGIPQIEVTFEIDADGILHVSARDLATGSGQTVTIATDHQLSDREVQRIVEEAREWATRDEEHRELIAARAVAQQIIYQTERSLAYLNGQTSAAVQREINSKIAALETAVPTTDVQRIRQLTRAVQEASMVLCPSATQPQAESV